MQKAYVDVYALHRSDGRVEPKGICFRKQVYTIERTLRKTRVINSRTGRTGIRYTVCISGKPASLFDEENGKWFVVLPE